MGVGVLGLGGEKNLLGEKNQKKIWARGGKIAWVDVKSLIQTWIPVFSMLQL